MQNQVSDERHVIDISDDEDLGEVLLGSHIDEEFDEDFDEDFEEMLREFRVPARPH